MPTARSGASPSVSSSASTDHARSGSPSTSRSSASTRARRDAHEVGDGLRGRLERSAQALERLERLAAHEQQPRAYQRHGGRQQALAGSAERELRPVRELLGLVELVPPEMHDRERDVVPSPSGAGRSSPRCSASSSAWRRAGEAGGQVPAPHVRRGSVRVRDEQHVVVGAGRRLPGGCSQVIGRRVRVAGPELGDAELGEGEGANVGGHGAVPRIVEHRPRGGQRLAQVSPRSRPVEVGGRGADREAMGAVRRQALAQAVRQASGTRRRAHPRRRRGGFPASASASSACRATTWAGIRSTTSSSAAPSPRARRLSQWRPSTSAASSQSSPSIAWRRAREHLVPLAVPATCPRVELGPVRRHATGQLDAQQLPEERVVREPVAVVVERGDEGAAPHQLLEPAAARRSDPVSASASDPFTCSTIAVRSRKSSMSGDCRDTTSAIR